MAEDEQTRQSSSSRSSKGAKTRNVVGSGGGPTENTLAPVAGTYSEDRPAEEVPGTPEHLGSDRPYEGAVPEAEQQ